MGIKKTLVLIETLKANGVIHFKSGEFDITFDAKVKLPAKAQAQPAQEQQQMEFANPEDTKRAEELLNLVKMTPEQLADQMFPAGAN